jgi:UDP-N-acetylmuramoyl-tripeptide--D-alanyl-D-alanine ligase
VEDVRSGFDGLSFTLNGRLELALPLLGAHNALNAAAAFAVARRLGLTEAKIVEALRQAEGPPMRLERLSFAAPGGTIRVINDAYNANPESMLAAVQVFAELGAAAGAAAGAGVRRRVVVLGDMLELGEAGPEAHREIGEALARARCADLVILVGPLMLFAADRLRRVMPPDAVVLLESLDGPRAAAAAARLAAGDLVLLKGSRGMGLERVLASLQAAAPVRQKVAQPRAGV